MGSIRLFNGGRSISIGAALSILLGAASYAAPKAAPQKSPAASSAGIESSPASAPAKSKTLLDTAKVRRLYLDGDFDEAIDKLETSLLYGKGHTHEDSVFAFKHLGVMHAAKYETREKGKRYMHQLLSVEPTARILDMYASDMIYMIFKNIKDEFDARHMQYDRADDLVSGTGRRNSAVKDAGDQPPPKGKSGGNGKYWVGAGAMAVAAGAVAWYYYSDGPESVTRNHEVK